MSDEPNEQDVQKAMADHNRLKAESEASMPFSEAVKKVIPKKLADKLTANDICSAFEALVEKHTKEVDKWERRPSLVFGRVAEATRKAETELASTKSVSIDLTSKKEI